MTATNNPIVKPLSLQTYAASIAPLEDELRGLCYVLEQERADFRASLEPEHLTGDLDMPDCPDCQRAARDIQSTLRQIEEIEKPYWADGFTELPGSQAVDDAEALLSKDDDEE